MDVLPLRTVNSPAAKTNFAGFDVVRALAAFGVVLLHSCVPYLQHPMPGLAWPVRDRANVIVDFGFWWIELFIMPLFLVIAGFLAWRTLQRRGTAALVKSRAKRLLALYESSHLFRKFTEAAYHFVAANRSRLSKLK